MKTERRKSLETINVTAEQMVPWRRPPSGGEASNTRTDRKHRGSGNGMSAKEQVVNTGKQNKSMRKKKTKASKSVQLQGLP